MKVNLKKDKLNAIDNAFTVIKEHGKSESALKIIKESLEDCFKDSIFDINIVNNEDDKVCFVMSVFPETTVIDKIISATMNDKETKAIQKLWETNKKWTIEIDSKLFDDDYFDLSSKELTAILLHEIGHIVCSTSIPNRVSLILRYELMKSSLTSKMMLRDSIFRKIMSLPILDACISDGKRDRNSIKEEVKADSYAKKMGYSNELLSVLTKLMKSKYYPNDASMNDKLVKNTQFGLQTLEDFQTRKDKLSKQGLLSLRENCHSPYINSVIDEFIETVFNDPDDSLSIYDGKKIQYMQERADKDIEDGYFTEFFLFKKELKRIDPAEIDYIYGKISGIKNENDRMMVVSYIHSKLDLVEYYISLLENKHTAKKYDIPHTLVQLKGMRIRLLELRKIALKQRIPERNKNTLVVWYPDGYEG